MWIALGVATADEPTTTTAPAESGPIRYGEGKVLAILQSPAVDESSGLAAGRLREGVFWTHNDSGDSPRLYALDRQGRDLGSVVIAGARARDWEDITSFTRDGKSWLLIADTGNNLADQKSARLYLVPEPEIDPGTPPAPAQVAMTIRFSYEDGPRDCEAVAVDAAAGKIYLATKTLLPICRVYELALPEAQPDETLIARAIGTVTISLATGMDISPDGRRMVICNYSEAVELTRRVDEDWQAALDRLPRRLTLPPRRQGESICYGPDGRSLYLTSERRPTPLIEIPALTEDIPEQGRREQ